MPTSYLSLNERVHCNVEAPECQQPELDQTDNVKKKKKP